jgi:acyl-coenzyme A synthetase/AMP-(fatty) acid ligase
MARVLCSDPESGLALRGLDHLFVGGEALPEDLAAALASACGTVTNLYGPTETTIWSSTHRVASGPPRDGPAGTVPIGRPIANTSFYVLDEGLSPLPIGVAGELFIGGHGVARGYLRRPDLDAQRFLPDPFAGVAGARMYRTGDLVRYRADGVVDFLGRTDQQVKVRGHRIEPGEIESLLAREPSVVEAVVVAREDVPGDQRLVAYVVARGPAPDPALLRERLASQLPAWMVPSQFVFLERIPRTLNRKIDRAALPAADPSPPRPSECVLPSTELEAQLTQLWQSVLGIARVGVEENFFDIGGHSVLAVRIHRRLRELTSKRVSLTDLFRFPTIRSLARFLTAEAAPDGLDEASLRGRRRRRAMHQARSVTGEA